MDVLQKLREPFPAHQISKLPKETRAQIDERKSNRNVGISCPVCGAWHHRNAIHLDYVGHAALTDRLLDTDMSWSWEPVAFGADGLPAFDRNGGLWIKLTVDNVTRLGYGAADGKAGGDAVKEIIGDALRNAAMRFGAALDLWHKGDLHQDNETPVEEGGRPANEEPRKPQAGQKLDGPHANKTQLDRAARDFIRELNSCADQDMLNAFLTSKEAKATYNQLKRDWPGYLGGEGMPAEFIPINDLIAEKKDQLPPAEHMEAAE